MSEIEILELDVSGDEWLGDVKSSSASWDVGERLRAEGISHWGVAVVEANADATRLYERVGFRPFYRQLLAEV